MIESIKRCCDCDYKYPILVQKLFEIKSFECFRATTGRIMANTDFYLRYYVGHKGKFGHEFLEFEFRPDGKLR